MADIRTQAIKINTSINIEGMDRLQELVNKQRSILDELTETNLEIEQTKLSINLLIEKANSNSEPKPKDYKPTYLSTGEHLKSMDMANRINESKSSINDIRQECGLAKIGNESADLQIKKV